MPVADDDISKLKRAIADGNVEAVEELLESGRLKYSASLLIDIMALWLVKKLMA